MSRILLITAWDSVDSAKKLAVENSEIAKYYPEDDDYLLELEDCPEKYQDFESDSAESHDSKRRNTSALGR